MAAVALIPNNEKVYRGMSCDNWCKRGIVNYRAFMLRPANDRFPIPEAEISLGRTPEAAVSELASHYGVAELSVEQIHGLQHALTVSEDPEDDLKAYILGLPLFSTDETLRALAIAMATDLAKISYHLPVIPTTI